MDIFHPLYAKATMKSSTGQHRFYRGVDLQARTLGLHVLDTEGRGDLVSRSSGDKVSWMGRSRSW
jgi:hypothetical protein